MRIRLFVIAVAACLSLASAGSSKSAKEPSDGSSWIDGDNVFVRVELDGDDDAIAAFRLGANNKGCEAQESQEGAERLLVAQCNEGMFGVSQSGRTVTYACPHAQRNAEQCREYALLLIDAAAGEGDTASSSGTPTASSSGVEMNHTDDGTPYFELDFSDVDTAGTDLFNIAEAWFKASGCTDVAQKRGDGYVQAVCEGIIVVGVPLEQKLHVGCAESSDAQCAGIHDLLMTTLRNM